MSQPNSLVTVRAVGTIFPNKQRSIPALRHGDRAALEPSIARQLIQEGLARVVKREKAEAANDAG